MRPQIPIFKDVQPLLEIDRDERKFDVFLTYHRSRLLVGDMKIFLPFTINLDPYIKKKIKEEQQNIDEEAGHLSIHNWNNTMGTGLSAPLDPNWPMRTALTSRAARTTPRHVANAMPLHQPTNAIWPTPRPEYNWQLPQWLSQVPPVVENLHKPLSAVTTLPVSRSY